MPSQVLAILMSTRSRPIPACRYRPMRRRALARVASVSKLSPASTSVETRPGTTLRIWQPKVTKSLSMNAWVRAASSPGESRAKSSASSTKVLVLRLLRRLQEQRRVRGCVLRPVFRDGFDVARVGHDRRPTFQGFEHIHAITSCGVKVLQNVV